MSSEVGDSLRLEWRFGVGEGEGSESETTLRGWWSLRFVQFNCNGLLQIGERWRNYSMPLE